MPKTPTNVRLPGDFKDRLKKCADAVGITPSAFIQAAVIAGITACEQCGYKIVMPLEFDVRFIAVRNPYLNQAAPLKKQTAA